MSVQAVRKVRAAAAAVGGMVLAAAMVRVAAAVAMAIRHFAPFIGLCLGRLVAVACWLGAADLMFWAAIAIHAAMMAANQTIGTQLLLSMSDHAASHVQLLSC